MKSSYDSAEHRAIHARNAALREHALRVLADGNTPLRIIDILERHKCPPGLLERIALGVHELTGGDRKALKKISASEIPPVTPLQKPEEPKRVVKHTPLWEPKVPYVSWDRIARGARPGDSSWSKYHDDAVLIDQLRQAGKYPANPEQTEAPADTVKIDIDDLRECTGTGPGVVTIPRKILNDIVKLNGLGRIIIIKEDTGGFSIEYYSRGNKDSFSGQTIEEIIPHIVFMMREIYPDRFES